MELSLPASGVLLIPGVVVMGGSTLAAQLETNDLIDSRSSERST
jgi:hypothetical protein